VVEKIQGAKGRWGKLYEKNNIDISPKLFPASHQPNVFYPFRRFINIIVKNEGRELATNCEVRLTLKKREPARCEFLSYVEKPLLWNDGKAKMDIGARGANATFHLAFSQERLTKEQKCLIIPANCGVVNGPYLCECWVGTRTALKNTAYADQDGLCRGAFTVHVRVSAESGDGISKHFNITVGDNWEKLFAKMENCNCQRSKCWFHCKMMNIILSSY
jgi:hypothetical protein